MLGIEKGRSSEAANSRLKESDCEEDRRQETAEEGAEGGTSSRNARRSVDCWPEAILACARDGRSSDPRQSCDRHAHPRAPSDVYFNSGIFGQLVLIHQDRKSTRLNSSHLGISYAVFCL